MVAKRRIPKKKLREPDEFHTWGSQAMNYVLSHVTYVVLGVVLIAAITAAIFFWRQHRAASEEMAFTLLGKGITLYQQEEKREEALSTFSELITEYPRTRAGKIALLYRGRSAMLKQDYDSAISDFELFLKKSSQPFLRVIALNALGNSYSATGEYQQAIDQFQRIIDSGDAWLKPYALLQMGMCWEKLGEKEKAIAAYQESITLELPPPWGTLARVRLKELGGNKE